jgi:hypothetical protein
MIFWSDKRPITIEILKRLDLQALSRDLGSELEYLSFANRRKEYEMESAHGQISLGIAQKRAKYLVNEEVTPDQSQKVTGHNTAR